MKRDQASVEEQAAKLPHRERARLALRLIQEARRAFQFIREYPLAASVERGELRVRTVARFPYRIYTRARPDEVLIVAIGHSRRRPGFWRSGS